MDASRRGEKGSSGIIGTRSKEAHLSTSWGTAMRLLYPPKAVPFPAVAGGRRVLFVHYTPAFRPARQTHARGGKEELRCEGAARTDAAGDELERARLDLLARGSDANDDRLAPPLVAALQRRSHHLRGGQPRGGSGAVSATVSSGARRQRNASLHTVENTV